MTETYYRLGQTVFRTRESETEYFIEGLESGKWVTNPSFMKYIFGGETGAVEIPKALAVQLEKELG